MNTDYQNKNSDNELQGRSPVGFARRSLETTPNGICYVRNENRCVRNGNHLVQNGNHLVQNEIYFAQNGNHFAQNKIYFVQNGNHFVQNKIYFVQNKKYFGGGKKINAKDLGLSKLKAKFDIPIRAKYKHILIITL